MWDCWHWINTFFWIRYCYVSWCARRGAWHASRRFTNNRSRYPGGSGYPSRVLHLRAQSAWNSSGCLLSCLWVYTRRMSSGASWETSRNPSWVIRPEWVPHQSIWQMQRAYSVRSKWSSIQGTVLLCFFAVLRGEAFVSEVLLSHPVAGFPLYDLFLYSSFRSE